MQTLLTVFIVAVEVVLFLWNTTLMLIGVILGPAVVMYTVCAIAIRFFRQIEKEPGSVTSQEDE